MVIEFFDFLGYVLNLFLCQSRKHGQGIIPVSHGECSRRSSRSIAKLVQSVKQFDVEVVQIVQNGFYRDLPNFISLKYKGSIDLTWSNSPWVM